MEQNRERILLQKQMDKSGCQCPLEIPIWRISHAAQTIFLERRLSNSKQWQVVDTLTGILEVER